MSRRPLSWYTGGDGLASPRSSFVAQGFPSFHLDASDVSRGAVSVIAKSPSGNTFPMEVIDADGVFSTNFMPTEIGDWEIMILYEGQHVDGSPFTVRVHDPGQVKVSGPSIGVVGATVVFAIDASVAGEGRLTVDVSLDGRLIPAHVTPGEPGRYHVGFVPDSPGVHQLRVYFAGVEISGSPLTVDVMDSRSVTVSGSGLTTAEVSQLTTFTVSTGQRSVDNTNNILVFLRSPKGTTTAATVTDAGDGSYNVEFTPTDIGEHVVDVLYHDRPITGSPFRCQVFNSSQVHVRDLPPYANVGSSVEFDVDASDSGRGNIEITINDGVIPCHVTQRSSSQFHASFVPRDASVHYVAMTFNGCTVPGSPWRVAVQDASKVGVTGSGIRQMLVGRTANVDVNGYKTPATVTVLSPSGAGVAVKCSKQKSGTQRFEYTPFEVGPHTVSVICGGQPMTGSPFIAKAYSTSAIQLTGMPAVAVIHHPVEFTVDVNKAGEGQLEIMVNKGSVANSVRMLSTGVYQVSFVPKEAKPHTVDIKFNSTPLPGGSVVVPVIDVSRAVAKGDGLQRATVNCPTTFRVSTKNCEADLAVTVTAADDPIQQIPVVVRGSPSKGFDVEYITTAPGTYVVDAQLAGVDISGSPFIVKSFDKTRVRVFGLTDGVVNKLTTFSVSVAEAGEGNMEISITPANGRNLPNEVLDVGGGMFEVSFTPRESGSHRANILFNSEHISCSPFKFNVTDVSRVMAKGRGLSSVVCRQPASFTITTPSAAAAGAALKQTDFDVCITGPDGRVVKNQVRSSGKHGFLVEYTPHMAGQYKVNITCNGVAISGSPFVVSVWDATQVEVFNVPPAGRAGKPSTFNINASRAGIGNLEVTVSSNTDSPSNFVDADNADGHYRVTFTPLKPETYNIVVKFNGDPVPGSPFYHSVLDGRMASARGPGLEKVIAHKPTTFNVFASAVGGDTSLNVNVQAPSGKHVPVDVTGSSQTSYTVTYTPTEIGQHVVSVRYADVDIGGSPFYAEVFDPDQVRVSNIPQTAVRDQPINFDVRTEGAGVGGMLSVVVRGRNSQPAVEISRRQTTAGHYDVTFTPTETGSHSINVLLSDLPVTGSPFQCIVTDPNSVAVSWESIRLCPAQQPAQLGIDLKALSLSDVDAKVTDPYGKTVSSRVSPVGSRHRLEFRPTDIGPHTIDIKYSGQPVPGSPYTANVYDVSRVRLTDAPSSGVVGNDVQFTVDTSEAGLGDVDVTVTCSSGHVDVKRHNVDEFRQKFTFVPSLSIKHDVSVTFNKQHVTGSPLTLSVVDGSSVMSIKCPTEPAPVDCVNYVAVDKSRQNEHINLSQCHVKVTASTGDMVPAEITQQPGGGYQLEYVAKSAGQYVVEVLYNGRHVTGSPFHQEIFDHRKVKLESAKPSGFIGDEMSLNVIRDNAGKADLGLKITGPKARASIPFNIAATERGDHVTYVAKETGTYVIDVTYGRQTVPGSPVKHTVKMSAAVAAYGDGLITACEGKTANFEVNSKGQRGELVVNVNGPNSVVRSTVEHRSDGIYHVTYVPTEVGDYSVHVRWNGREVQGSPFHPSVVNPSRVQLVGGWEKVMDPQSKFIVLHLHEPFSLEFDTRAAGPGHITAEIRCSEGYIPVDVVQRGPDYYIITFQPKVPGEYEINVLWNEMRIPGCPVIGRAVAVVSPTRRTRATPPPVPNRDKIILTGHGLDKARVNQQAEFVIDATGASPGVPDVKLTGLHSEVTVRSTPLGSQKYRCTYSPTVPGLHLLYILWRNRLVQGCPYEVTVTAGTNAPKVSCSGEGLREGAVAQQFRIHIDARRAARGELAVRCDGPTQSANCQLVDNLDGTFTLDVTATEAGRHVLTIEYDGQHVAGSPFVVLVSGAPDAGKVHAHGPGIENGLLSTFQGQFVVETAGAGSGQLTVKVRGPRGGFRVEMHKDAQQSRTIACRYDPTEPGMYAIQVMWSGTHIPGSPFLVQICATRSELERLPSSDWNDPPQFNENRAISPQSSWPVLPND